MMISDILFTGFCIITVTGALLAVHLKRVFYNALALAFSLFGVAGLFIFLRSEFLAVMEMIIYVGAITVAIIFAIMLSNAMKTIIPPRDPKKILRTGSAIIFFVMVSKALLRTRWPYTGDVEADYSVKRIGEILLSQYVLVFEAASLVLLVAIIGALLISRSKEGPA